MGLFSGNQAQQAHGPFRRGASLPDEAQTDRTGSPPRLPGLTC